MNQPIIELEHVFFSYSQVAILSDVTLKVFPGEFIGIIGPNGGGKTTLLKLILGFLKPSKGILRLFGENPRSHLPCQRLAYVPQSVRFDKQFPISALEVVLSGLLSRLPWYGSFREEDKEAAYDALNKVGLKKFAHSAFGTLSGGQAQRVLIARALVSNPQILLLDEPTASVDSKAEEDIYAILQELKGTMTILMVTHNLNAALNHVQRLFCVQGHVLSMQPEEVCEHFALGLYHAPFALRNKTPPAS